VLYVVVELLRFPVLLVGFDGTALDGEYDCCAYTEKLLLLQIAKIRIPAKAENIVKIMIG
jgi:hypothetical protein